MKEINNLLRNNLSTTSIKKIQYSDTNYTTPDDIGNALNSNFTELDRNKLPSCHPPQGSYQTPFVFVSPLSPLSCIPGNYRPISVLPAVTKLIEKNYLFRTLRLSHKTWFIFLLSIKLQTPTFLLDSFIRRY